MTDTDPINDAILLYLSVGKRSWPESRSDEIERAYGQETGGALLTRIGQLLSEAWDIGYHHFSSRHRGQKLRSG